MVLRNCPLIHIIYCILPYIHFHLLYITLGSWRALGLIQVATLRAAERQPHATTQLVEPTFLTVVGERQKAAKIRRHAQAFRVRRISLRRF